MTSHSQFIVTDVQSITKESFAQLSFRIQDDHNYCLPLIKEEEYIIEDDVKVVEITEEVDVSMHIGENGTTYLQDVNGVQWNLENPDICRLDDLSWKPLRCIVKTEPEYENVSKVDAVRNCFKCAKPLNSNGLCVSCIQPKVQLTDILKTKEYRRDKQLKVNLNKRDKKPGKSVKKFYVVKKSDVQTFVHKNMGKLSILNQYKVSEFSNAKSADTKNNDPKKEEDTNNKIRIKKIEQNDIRINSKRKSAQNHKFLCRNKLDINKEEESVEQKEKPPILEMEEDKEPVVQKEKPQKVLKKKYVCVACDSTFYKLDELHSHMKNHKPPFGCNRCKLNLVTNKELISHSVVHNIVILRKYKCKICNKEMKSLKDLRTHSYTHVKNKEYPCDKCDAEFETTSKLIAHKIKHGILPYECKLCHRQFKQSGYLRRHYCPKRWSTENLTLNKP